MLQRWPKQLVLLLMVLAQTATLQLNAAEPLVINTMLAPPLIDLEKGGLLDRTVSEAFRRLGIEIVYQPISAQRSLLNVDTGLDDGNLARVKGLTDLFPNIRMIPESLMNFRFVAFSRDQSIKIENWDSLQDYNVAIIRGWKIVEANTAQIRSVIKVKSGQQLFRLLKQGRVDIVIFGYAMGLRIAESMNIRDIHVLKPNLAERDLFLYMNKKHEPLIPRIDQALREMKADGSYERIYLSTMPADR